MTNNYTFRMEWFISSVESVIEDIPTESNHITQNEVDALLDKFAEHYDEALYHDLVNKRRFQQHMQDTWGYALDMLRYYILVSERAGILFSEIYGSEYQTGDYRFDALSKLHGRACRVSREVLILLNAGYASGAMARWRSIYEMAGTAIFISNNSQNTAERFLDYRVVEDYYEAEEFQKYSEELGFEPISDESWETIEENFEKMIGKHGEEFKDFHGWLVTDLGNNAGRSDLFEASGIDEYEPFYNFANNPTHGGSKGSQYQLGIPDELVPLGPSANGLIDPAQMTVIMLNRVVGAFLSLGEEVYWSVISATLDELRKDVVSSFVLVPQLSYLREYIESIDLEDLNNFEDVDL